LSEAGFLSLADLEGLTREQLRAIRGVGLSTLEVIEELLGKPLPRERKSRSAPARPPWPEEVWRKRGLPPGAAITFTQVGMTLERLRVISREELLGMLGVGPQAVHACERLIGKPIPSRKRDPVAALWRSQGIQAKAARSLSQAGIGTPADLRKLSREELLALPGIGTTVLGRLEALVGSEIPSRTAYWLRRKVSLVVAHTLIRQGIFTLEDFGGLTRDEFLSLPGLGPYALRQCERLLGRGLSSPRHYWLDRGFSPVLARKLARAGVNTLADLETQSEDALRAAGLDAPEINLCKLVGSHAR